jgi:hypothetical protein
VQWGVESRWRGTNPISVPTRTVPRRIYETLSGATAICPALRKGELFALRKAGRRRSGYRQSTAAAKTLGVTPNALRNTFVK